MYMQSDPPIPPKNYSGSVFAPRPAPPHEEMRPRAEQEPPPPAAEASSTAAESPSETAEVSTALEETGDDRPRDLHEAPHKPENAEAESIPASARIDGRRGGFLSRFPLLSSFLPPPRHSEGGKERGLLPDWMLLGAVALLFLADENSDILPFLLLLLLWD